ncbi:ferrochelatase [Dissulfurirhabdus thermomarina]|uniref:Ferrochelatase n=1 Tax=Dissulfurirhabdus thermomarina TaxID=1765737 RepID=A0A6N9TQS4_DISTH|nr:ferrochelatase [Dissulfurirhabdus thermomarina]NDY42800.1 ferrochelatase [Dissulfurirhabdus thermomarina]NMX23858.1 ferrochelatase [Dissulfurirhabdus thermomarina]
MTGVVLLNMGGPDGPEAVRPFLFNLFSDRRIIRLGPPFLQRPLAWWISRRRAPKSRAAYLRIGGASPLARITAAQAAALERALNAGGGAPVTCRAGMRYWHPRTPDVLRELAAAGVRRVLGLSLYPHFSGATSGTSLDEFFREARRLGLEAAAVEAWPDDPGYIEALLEVLREGLSLLGGAEGRLPGDAALLYSAHSLPRRMVERGDPYVAHLERTIRALEARSGIRGHLAYQSRSGPVRWLEPATDVRLLELVREGARRVLVLPISFVSDHIETLYEIDMLYADMVTEAGGRLFRTPSLNDRLRFIEALAGIAGRRLEAEGWRGSS